MRNGVTATNPLPCCPALPMASSGQRGTGDSRSRETRPMPNRQLTIWEELKLAVLPTGTVLLAIILMELVLQQRLLFTSLASSAFLIYLDPGHAMNTVRTLVVSHLLAAVIGSVAIALIGPTYVSAALAMIAIIVVLVTFGILHPPAVSTALAFAFRPAAEDNLLLFAAAVGMIALLVLLQRAVLFLLARRERTSA